MTFKINTRTGNIDHETVDIKVEGISDIDGDTRIHLEKSSDEDIIRFDVGDNPAGYNAILDIMTLSSSGWNVNMGTAGSVATSGAPINLTAGTGNTSGSGGSINLTGGDGGATSGDGGNITITPGSSSGGTAGQTTITDSSSNNLVVFDNISSSAVNYIRMANATTNSGPEIAAMGNDADVDLLLTPKGLGNLVLGGLSWPNMDGTSGQALTTDGSGNLIFETISGSGSSGGAYIYAELSSAQSSNLSTANHIEFNQIEVSNGIITLSTGVGQQNGMFTLPANRVYKLEAQLFVDYNSQAFIDIMWRNNTTGSLIGNLARLFGNNFSNFDAPVDKAVAIVDATVTTEVELVITSTTASLQNIFPTGTYAIITEI